MSNFVALDGKSTRKMWKMIQKNGEACFFFTTSWVNDLQRPHIPGWWFYFATGEEFESTLSTGVFTRMTICFCNK
jgi:hypothetical protein